jgi:hypothetical protein
MQVVLSYWWILLMFPSFPDYITFEIYFILIVFSTVFMFTRHGIPNKISYLNDSACKMLT